MVLLGVPAFVLVVWPLGAAHPGLRRVVQVGWLVAAGSAVWLFVLQGPYGAGLGLGAVVDPELWGQTLGSQFGKLLLLLLLRLVALATAIPLLRRLFTAGSGGSPGSGGSGEDRLVPLAALAVLYTVSFAYAEHSGIGAYQPFAGLADVAHLAAASIWLGGLVVLGIALAPGASTAGGLAEALPGWSRLAMGCVAVLIVTGLAQAWRQTGEVAALTGTEYGRYLIAKTVLLAGILAIAETSRRVVAKAAGGGLRTE